MKSVAIVLFAMVSCVSTNNTLSCDPWPENLKTVRDCCNIPYHSNSILLNHCFEKCESRERSDDERNECAAKCYGNVTLMITDGKINKKVVIRIYGNNAFYQQHWMKLINESVENCEFDEFGTVAGSLAKFFECVNLNLENNCVSFTNTPECDKVQELFEKCHNYEPDCSQWPENLINPEICCKTPPLFNSRLIATCRRKCSALELFLPRIMSCIDGCLYNETKLKIDGRFDFEVVEKFLIENSKNQPEWENPIKDAVGKCETKMKGKLKKTGRLKFSEIFQSSKVPTRLIA